MLNPSPEWQPILPYPSRRSLAELVIAQLERSSGIALPEDWPENEPYYLERETALNHHLLRDAIEVAVRGAEPGGWLSDELAYFERMMAADAIEQLESSPAGRIALDAIRGAALESYRKDPDAVKRGYGDEDD